MNLNIAFLQRYCLFLVFLGIFLCYLPAPSYGGEQVLLSEEFHNLDNWEPFYFPKIKSHSTYTTIDGDVLKAESRASASAIIYKTQFNVYDYPMLQWRWKIENIYLKGDATKKSGDDYPLRLYVMFKYDPAKAGILKKMKYETAKALYGKYPPHSTLNYIWANKSHSDKILTNPYAGEAKMIPVEQGTQKLNTWLVEQADIVEDYRRAFGEEPPAVASLAIMNDSDNTGESSISYLDYIKIYRKAQTP
ncbi:MAG: DUF3047 domain-containing protein [Desulfobacteraceae bacterium]|nr:MAG: DUF3047 domain-containing protein [Desulfobacteraceae bacterium]